MCECGTRTERTWRQVDVERKKRKEKEGILTSRFLTHAARSKIGTSEAHAYFRKTMSSSLDVLNHQPSMTQSTAGDQQALG